MRLAGLGAAVPVLDVTDPNIGLGFPAGYRGACPVPLAPFSVSGEYARFPPEDGRDWRLLAEMFTMLKRAGATRVITYAAAGLAAALG